MKDKPLYLSGPMSGYPQFNFHAFDKAARWLRARGYDVISPAELDTVERERVLAMDDSELPKATDEEWREYLARDVGIVLTRCSGIVLLDGWRTSRGAKLELYAALLARMQVMRLFQYEHADWELTTHYAAFSAHQLRQSLLDAWGQAA